MYGDKITKTYPPYPINNSRVRVIHIRNSNVRIFRHYPQKEPGDEDHLDGCDEHRSDCLLRSGGIARWLIYSDFWERQE